MIIDEKTVEKIKKLNLPQRFENNQYLVYACYGDGVRADPKFNIKIFKGKAGYKIVTNDEHTFKCLLSGISTRPDHVDRIISIDDSGVGFLLGGVLCGMHDSTTDEISTKSVDVSYFQGENRFKKKYLDAYAKAAVELVESLHPDKEHTLIKICTGDVNVKAKEALRKLGYYVEVCEIKGKLQQELEALHKQYIEKEYGFLNYIDPKESNPRQLCREFFKLKKWVIKNKKQCICKENWGM